MRDALRLLAQALDPGQAPEAAAGALEALRSRWSSLDAEEREALTPVAKLAAQRLEAPRAAAAPADPDEAAYVAALEAMAGSAPADDAAAVTAAPPSTPTPRHCSPSSAWPRSGPASAKRSPPRSRAATRSS
jgi:ATP-dependent DNA helicase RecQ